jgi:hypothetical protein
MVYNYDGYLTTTNYRLRCEVRRLSRNMVRAMHSRSIRQISKIGHQTQLKSSMASWDLTDWRRPRPCISQLLLSYDGTRPFWSDLLSLLWASGLMPRLLLLG